MDWEEKKEALEKCNMKGSVTSGHWILWNVTLVTEDEQQFEAHKANTFIEEILITFIKGKSMMKKNNLKMLLFWDNKPHIFINAYIFTRDMFSVQN